MEASKTIQVPLDMAEAWLETLESLADSPILPVHIWPNHPYSPIQYLRKAISEAKHHQGNTGWEDSE